MTASDFGYVGPAPATQGSGVTWGIKEIVIGTVAVILLYILLGASIVLPVSAAYGENSAETLLAEAVTVVIWDAGMISIVFWIVRSKGGNWSNLGLHLPKLGSLGRVLGVIAAAYLASMLVVNLYEVLVDLSGISALQPSKQIESSFYSHTAALVVLGIAVVGTAPIAEEIFFRGFLFSGLDKRYGLFPALLVSGVLFALAHANGGLIIPFTVIGMLLALAYRYGRTLFADISVHFLFNLGSFPGPRLRAQHEVISYPLAASSADDFRSRCAIFEAARPRWLMRFFSSMLSWAIVRSRSGRTKTGS